MKRLALALLFLFSGAAFAQNASTAEPSRPPGVANYSVMLVNPTPGGGAVILMHSPKNELELVDVAKIKDALTAGYVPLRAVEIGELIASLKEEVARLTAENERLQGTQPTQTAAPPPPAAGPSPEEIAAQERAQADAQRAALRQQLILQIMQNMGTPAQPYRMPLPVPMQVYHDNRLQTNCTTQHVGDTAYTDCH